MINDAKKSLVLTAAIAAPLLMSAPAAANTNSNWESSQAIAQFTTSVEYSLDAYDSLSRGDVTLAQTKLDEAVRQLESAIEKDPTLGFRQKPAKAFHADLITVKTKFNSRDSFEAKTELDKLLKNAGIISAS